MLELTNLKDNYNNFFYGLRRLIFANIYPAPNIVNPRTRVFIGLQFLANDFIRTHSYCHHVWFDYAGNIYTSQSEKFILPDRFEALIMSKSRNFYDPKTKYIIYIGGNTTCFQVLINEMTELHEQKNACVIAFNPPGVGMSPGHTDLDLYLETVRTVIDNLAANGIPFKKILIFGHSLGGGIAAKIVAEYRKQGKDIFLFVDRTMLSVSEAVGVRVRKLVPTWLLRKTLGYLLYILAKLLIKFLKLELDVAADFTLINKIAPGAAHGTAAHGDEMLGDCSLSQGIDTPTPYLKHFKLKDDTDPNRKTHSVQRHNLIEEEGEVSAEQFLHHVIKQRLSFDG